MIIKQINTLLLFTLVLFSFSACTSTTQQGDSEPAEQEDNARAPEEPTASITLTELTEFHQYPDAGVALGNTSIEGSTINFEFDVKNYELGVQTPDAEKQGLANSGKGQHIHLILDNNPYTAHYEPKASREVEEGSHVVLAFPARSYHLSVKNEGGYILKEIIVGEGESNFDADGSYMFYSRPKGTYEGAGAKKVLLDFFLHNVELSADGHHIRATINGQEFMINKWAPHVIEGMPMGENTIKLELLDADGELVDTRFNPVERTITLKE